MRLHRGLPKIRGTNPPRNHSLIRVSQRSEFALPQIVVFRHMAKDCRRHHPPSAGIQILGNLASAVLHCNRSPMPGKMGVFEEVFQLGGSQ